MLSLKDQCILTITENPSITLNIPEELVSHLYLGIYYSKKLENIIICSKCGDDRPCKHDKTNRCMAVIKEGKRCPHSGINYRGVDGKYLCDSHQYQPRCYSEDPYCRELALDPAGGPCWNHDRKYKCVEKDYDGNYCSQYATNRCRCKRHLRMPFSQHHACKVQDCSFVKHWHIYLRCGLCIGSADCGISCPAVDMCYNHAKQLQTQVTSNNSVTRKRKSKEMYEKMSKLILL